MLRDRRYDLQQNYHLRVMMGMVVSLVLLLVAFNLWPVFSSDTTEATDYGASEQELIGLEDIQPTRQTGQAKPPPPAPLPPVVMPDEVILEEEELIFSDNSLLPLGAPGPETSGSGAGEGKGGGSAGSSVIGPKPIRFVEPEYTREARRRKIRAEVVVEVVIDEHGKVRDTEVVGRYLLTDNEGEKKAVEAVGYGLEEAAIDAAARWQFRPARRDNQPVQGSTVLTFRFGV